MKSLWKSYGCEQINPNFDPDLQKFLNRMEWKNILEVPRRTKGMTSSGEPKECHQNVNKLVNTIGGCALRGFWVSGTGNAGPKEVLDFMQLDQMSDCESLILTYHSVWVSPEGNATDVTMRNYEENFNPLFIPLYETNEEIMKIWDDILVRRQWKTEGFMRMNRGLDLDPISIAQFKNNNKKYIDNLRKEWTEEGKGFSKPSMVSKLTFDEFEKLYRNKREFTGFGKS